MSCHKITDGKSGFVCLPNIYEYEGFTFEFHNYLGPCKLKKDLEPAKRTGEKFYDVLKKFLQLSNSERKKHQIYG